MSRFSPWIPRLAGVGATQALVQALAMASGLLIVRYLAPADYALYVLAHTILGTMSVLGDSGIANGAMAEGGKIWQNPFKLGQVVATAKMLRRAFALWLTGLTVPVFIYLQRDHGASWPVAIGLCGITVTLFWFGVQSSIFGVAPALHQVVRKTQQIAVVQNVIRLAGVGGAVLVAPSSVVALLSAVPGYVWAAWRLRRLSTSFADPAANADPAVRTAVLKVVRRTMPASVYYVVSGQISLWVLSFLGTTLDVAQLGALGRVGQVFAVVQSVIGVVIAPRFARLPEDRVVLVRRYLQVMGGVILLGALAVWIAAVLPEPILWVLGPEYAGLKRELVLLVLASVLALTAGTAYVLPASRGVVINPAVSIPFLILLQVLLCLVLNVGTLRGALLLGVWGGVAQAIVVFAYGVGRFRRGPVTT